MKNPDLPMLRRWTGTLVFFCAGILLQAQDHQWWADNVQWDGKTHWSTYIISKPRYLGPNALPVPELTHGKVPAGSFLDLTGQAHFRNGDQTYNPLFKACYLVAPRKIALELVWVPVEYFNLSHDLKTERRIFHLYYDDHTAVGDIYLHTYLQLTEEERFPLSSMLRVGYRLPSSTKQGAARFTDAPGYYLDVSGGKAWNAHWSLSLMLGFYVWQTNLDDQLQNDAFLFGTGISWADKGWTLQGSFRGYLGYMGAGDDPLLASVQFGHSGSRTGWHAGFQQGFLDWRYSSVQVGLKIKVKGDGG